MTNILSLLTKALLAAAVALPWSTMAMASPNGAKAEGIQVHGDWVLTIHDPDGSLVLEMPFKNALTDTGKGILERIFTGEFRMIGQDPSIFSIGAGGFNTGENQACVNLLQDLDLETRLVAGQGATYTRSLSLGSECVNGASWELARVFTLIYYEDEIGAGFGNFFTSKTLATPVAVLPDQVVTLKVSFTFE